MNRETEESGRRLQAREREAQAVELRKNGLSYAAIGAELGISDEGARKACKRALERMLSELQESAEELREIELGRLDHMQTALWQKALDGDCQTIDRVLRIMQRRAKLAGLDAPERVEQTINEAGYTDDQIQEAARILTCTESQETNK